MEKFVRRAAADIPVREEGTRYITMFYAYAITGFTVDWSRSDLADFKKSLPEQFIRTFDASVEMMLKTYAENEA